MGYVPPDFKYTVLPPPPPQPFVTAFNLNGRPTRNDFAGFTGMKLTVGANNLSVSSVGRVCIAGNTQTHTVELVNAGTNAVVGSANVNMAGCTPGTLVYATLASPITLTAGTGYYLASQESNGGDMWYGYGTLTSAAVAQAINSAYLFAGTWQTINGTNSSYVPANFLYQIAP
jgi:hypothetical protein